MTDQLAGLLGSASLYFGSNWLLTSFDRRVVRTLPPEWREHPELREAFDAYLKTDWHASALLS
jgi:hypothetical protein